MLCSYMSFSISKKDNIRMLRMLSFLVTHRRLELRTPWLKVKCSTVWASGSNVFALPIYDTTFIGFCQDFLGCQIKQSWVWNGNANIYFKQKIIITDVFCPTTWLCFRGWSPEEVIVLDQDAQNLHFLLTILPFSLQAYRAPKAFRAWAHRRTYVFPMRE